MTRPVCAFNNPTTGGGFITLVPSNVFVATATGPRPITVTGAPVTPHLTGRHLSAVMIATQNRVFANGLPVCGAGDFATCGDIALPLPTRVLISPL